MLSMDNECLRPSARSEEEQGRLSMTLEARQHGFHMALKSSHHHNDANAKRDSKSSNFWVDQHHRFEKQ